MPSVAHVTHLLRRTEFVARPQRVAELAALPSIGAAVDNVLAVSGTPPRVQFQASQDRFRVVELTDFWLDQMAHDAPRPIREKMALFWHGHFVSSEAKVGNIELMRRQIDLYRSKGLGKLADLAIEMSTTAAMLRYLDNNQNYIGSPNQNFGRELMELFILGVGNYTEDDVVACSEAWTGWTDIYRAPIQSGGVEHDTQYDNGVTDHEFRPYAHEPGSRTLLGRTINTSGDTAAHGPETIRTMLGSGAPVGTVPDTAAAVANRGRPTSEVAAEFLSRKLWWYFAGTEPSSNVLATLRDAALSSDFNVKTWLRTLLTHSEFYSEGVRFGLVRSPIDYTVALLAATGLRSAGHTPWWHMEGMGQRPLFPPNVAGWKHNAYWISASSFGRRAAVAQHFAYYALYDYWEGSGLRLADGTVTRAEVEAMAADPAARRALVGRLADMMQVTLGGTTRKALEEFASNATWDELHDLVPLIFASPEMNNA